MQIGKRVSCMEQAQLAMEQQGTNAQHENQEVDADDGMELNLDARYQISNTRNDAVDLYTYVRENIDDPVLSISIYFEHCVYLLIKRCLHHFRGLFQN